MRRPAVVTALLVALLVVTGGLALALAGGAAQQGRLPIATQAAAQTTQASKGPYFAVSVVLSAPGAGNGTAGVQVNISANPPEPGFSTRSAQSATPVGGVRFEVIGLPKVFHGKFLSNILITNSTGTGEISVLEGNYSVVGSGPYVNYKGYLSFKPNTVTSLTIKVVPAFGTVASLMVVNQDTLVGTEPTATVYAGVSGGANFSDFSTELRGYTAPGGASQDFMNVNMTVVGTYGTPGMTMVVLKPQGEYPALPSFDLSLLQYATSAEVSYLPV
jgi:hypothetical protein